MTHTWNWLFVTLPKDEKSKLEVIKNIEEQIFYEMEIGDFKLTFDFVNERICCDCIETYEFKSKVVPGEISFEAVKEFLSD